AMTEEEAWAYLYSKYPHLLDIVFPIGFNYNYALYYAENPDTIGYLKIPGTNIDTPVVQADNNKYYLNHDFYGKYTSYGAIYASYIDNFNVIDRNTLIYGHNMNDGTRFGSLKSYKSMDFFLEHPIIEFNTLYEKHKWKVCAVIITNGDVKGDNGYFFDFTFNNCSDTCFEEYIVELNKRKLYETGVDILPTDKLVTLCTCTYEFDNARLLVIGRMLREGESEEIDKTLVKKKDTPVKYPSSYYENKSKNPYKDDARWYLY
ncbi:MAG: class B sortase, partial [Clostridia bacterium]|nr:class B sortase [Clostridia bacterium]